MVAVALDVSERSVLYLSPHVRQREPSSVRAGDQIGFDRPTTAEGSSLAWPPRFKSTGYFRATLSSPRDTFFSLARSAAHLPTNPIYIMRWLKSQKTLCAHALGLLMESEALAGCRPASNPELYPDLSQPPNRIALLFSRV